QVVSEIEQRLQLLLQVVFNPLLRGPQAVQGSIQAILGYVGIRHPEEILQAGRGVPALGQGKLTTGSTQAIDDLDGDDVSRTTSVLAGEHPACHDLIQFQHAPQVPGQPDIAEAAGISPADLLEADANDVGIVGQVDVGVVRKQPQLLGVPLAV